LVIGSADIAEAELEMIDGITAGTAAASKAMVLDSSADITGGRNLTISGELDAATGDFSGAVDVAGALTTSTDVTAKTADGALLLLQTSEATVVDGDVLGGITFNAPNEGSGTDSVLVGAAIQAVAEATFAADNNATELVFKTGASAAADTKMTLTSGGNVGIGVAPADSNSFGKALDVGSATGAALYLRDVDSSKVGIVGQFNEQLSINSKQSNGNIGFYTGASNTQRMLVDSSGVDVTGTLTSDGLSVDSGSADTVATFESSGDAKAYIVVKDSGSSDGAFFGADGTHTIIGTGGTAERMRLTSAGDLLVGGTTTNHQDGSSPEQFSYMKGSFLAVSRSGATVAYFNRQSDDGEIAAFRKNGTTVGSIGVSNSNNLYIYGSASNHSGLNFGTSQILPARDQAPQDNTVDLGSSANRFKDLYLSGGAFIGGTGAANKLDDYEEGTFTPTFSSGFNSISYTTQKGAYTKIGRLVTIQLQINLDSATGTSGIINFSGLPFNAADSNSAFGGFYKSFNAGFNTNDGDVYHKEGSNAVIGVYSDGGGARVGNNGNIGTGGQIILVGHYYTP